jgi:hypothetical protein
VIDGVVLVYVDDIESRFEQAEAAALLSGMEQRAAGLAGWRILRDTATCLCSFAAWGQCTHLANVRALLLRGPCPWRDYRRLMDEARTGTGTDGCLELKRGAVSEWRLSRSLDI